MGITCKPIGNMKSFMIKNLKNEKSDKKLAPLAKEDNNKKNK